MNIEDQVLDNPSNPRHEIEEAISVGDLPKLLTMSGLLHSYSCPFLAVGVKASAWV